MQPLTTTTEPRTRERELGSLSVLTVIVVLAAATMTFAALITVFFVRSQDALFWGHLRIPGILWFSTALLLTSSFLLEMARRSLAQNDQRRFFELTVWTTGLGVLFLVGQLLAWFEILHSGVVLAHNPHSWFIFLFSGLHGAHILLGLAGLSYLLARTRRPVSGPKYLMTTRAVTTGVAIFWHYLDLLWILLFALLLIWRR